MTRRRVILCGVLAALLVSCVLCGTHNRAYLTDPPVDSVDQTWQRDLRQEVDDSDLEAMYALARESVDSWSPDAYFYRAGLRFSCTDLATPEVVWFGFLKVNHLDIYAKQWKAFVDLDFKDGEVSLQVEKEEDDPPPPLERRLDLERVSVSLPQVLETASQVLPDSECSTASLSLYKYIWEIAYWGERDGQHDLYTVVEIDALTGEILGEEGQE